MVRFPVLSIIIPTYNSARTLGITLESIKKQTYPQNKIEILVIDGGSHDNTLDIARRYDVKIISNSRTELIYAKLLGFVRAQGKYLLFLDSDEALENLRSLKKKVLAFQINNLVKIVSPSGYKTPIRSSAANYYINEFGDPFTFFIYKESKNNINLISQYKRKFKVVSENSNCIVFDFSKLRVLPYIEVWAGGYMIDLDYTRKILTDVKRRPSSLALLFYLLNKKNKLLAVTKNDPTFHDSSENIKMYLKKIASRVRNNVLQTSMGKAGFAGRETHENKLIRIKKYLFIPYSLLLILPAIDALFLTISRKKLIYLVHFPLTLYTASLIIYYYILRFSGVRVKLKTYGK